MLHTISWATSSVIAMRRCIRLLRRPWICEEAVYFVHNGLQHMTIIKTDLSLGEHISMNAKC